MSYTIETRSVSEFVSDSKIKLPRFQRKSTWTPKQNFELAISIFQQYPVGVVIINDEGRTSWLLDGRQRRNALKDLRANPDLVYEWARKYVKFKSNEAEYDVKTKFWSTVDAYLQHDDDNEDSSPIEDVQDEVDISSTFDINKRQQHDGLEILLEIILMVHQQKNGLGKWEKILDLKDFVGNNLPYALRRDDFKINPVALRNFLLDFQKEKENNIDAFIEYIDDRCSIKELKEAEFKKHISQNWSDISHFVDVIAKSEQIFTDARIGVILLKNVTPLDAQNIFSRINSGGTQLKAEELLSAKPFWNEPVNVGDSEMLDVVKDMYKRLGVEVPSDNNVVRWDFGATLVSRIRDKGLLFGEFPLKEKQEIDMNQVTLGFKLMSSYFIGGMSAIAVSAMEKQDSQIKWGRSINDLIDEVNKICEILLHDDFFKFLNKWKKPIYRLMGSAIVLEFITVLLKDWEDRGQPTTASNDLNNFMRDAKALFDRLVFEYAIGAWKGSGDSKMANHIKNWKDRIKPIDSNSWLSFIDESEKGSYNGQNLDIKHLTPILCYQYALQKKSPENALEETSEVDHIVPQAKLSGHPTIPKEYMDSLFNLVLLSKEDNNAKKDKSLNEILSLSLRDSYAKYADINIKMFDKFSDVANIQELKDTRLNNLKKIFGKTRESELAK